MTGKCPSVRGLGRGLGALIPHRRRGIGRARRADRRAPSPADLRELARPTGAGAPPPRPAPAPPRPAEPELAPVPGARFAELPVDVDHARTRGSRGRSSTRRRWPS